MSQFQNLICFVCSVVKQCWSVGFSNDCILLLNTPCPNIFGVGFVYICCVSLQIIITDPMTYQKQLLAYSDDEIKSIITLLILYRHEKNPIVENKLIYPFRPHLPNIINMHIFNNILAYYLNTMLEYIMTVKAGKGRKIGLI